MSILIVGAGSLGSAILMEIAKRCYSLDVNMNIKMCDDDTVEHRNISAQIFDPEDIGFTKLDAMEKRLIGYPISFTKSPIRFNKKTADSILSNIDLCIDVVDNVETRQLIWTECFARSIPVIHSGMNKSGYGFVQWSYNDRGNQRVIDTFSLSPATARKIQEPEKELTPPCVLNGLRTLIINTSMCAVNALFIYLGMDTANFYGRSSFGVITTWESGISSFRIIPEFTVA